MKMNRIISRVFLIIAGIAILCAFIPAQAMAKEGEETIKGLILSRDGENMLVRSETGNVTVTLTNATKVKVLKGLLGIRREKMGMASLIPGLRVEIEAQQVDKQTIAKVIKFKADDLKTANEIQAGLEMTRLQAQANKENIEANKEEIEKGKAEDAAINKRFSDLSEYDVKGETTVLFDVNSAKLSGKAKKDLKALADQAKGLKGYMIQVAGYTDSSGTADYNQELSDNRADSVIVYLRVSCGVPISRVLSGVAMGMARPVASNETAQGKAENRRVTAKILVNRGLSQ